MPTKIKPSYAQVKKCIEDWFQEHAHMPLEKDAHFMTMEAWKDRGEDYGGDNAILVMTFDGSSVYDYVNMHNGYQAHDDLLEKLGKLGCFFELMHSWSFAVYPN
jgi:hypothetical protein